MNFWFEMAINAVEVTLILSFLVQYFGYRMACPAKYIWTALFGVLSFGSVAFFSWGQLYEGYASSIQILINIAFCCILLRTNPAEDICFCIYDGPCGYYCNFYGTACRKIVRK